MTPPRRKPKTLRRWLLSAALLALAPKCAMCLLGYLGLGAVLGLGGNELCGAPSDPNRPWELLLLGVSALAATMLLLRRKRLEA